MLPMLKRRFFKQEIIAKQLRIWCYSLIPAEKKKKRVYRTGGQENKVERDTRGQGGSTCGVTCRTSLAMNFQLALSDVRCTKDRQKMQRSIVSLSLTPY